MDPATGKTVIVVAQAGGTLEGSIVVPFPWVAAFVGLTILATLVYFARTRG